MFARIGRLAANHPWRVIGAWVALAAVVIAFSPSIDSIVNEDDTAFVPDHYESVRADAAAERAFPETRGAGALLVFKRADGARLTSDDRRDVATAVGTLDRAGIERVGGVRTSDQAVSPNGELQLAQVAFRGDETDEPVLDAVKELRAETAEALDGSDLRVGMTGGAAIRHDFNESVDEAEGTVEIATIALIVLLMGLIFRSPVIALLPIVMVGLVSQVANGLIADSAELFGYEADFTLPILLIVVLFGIGTDYILFVLFRYRERLRAGDDPRDAVVFAVTRVGEAVASSALVVVAAFAAMVFSSLESNATLGPSLAISVVVMLAAALTLVPAVLGLVGPRVFWPSKAWQRDPDAGRIARFAAAVVRRPLAFAGGSFALLAVIAVAMVQLTPNYDQLAAVPDDKEAKAAYTDLSGAFPPGAVDPTTVVVTDDEPVDRAELTELAAQIERVDGVQAVAPPQLSGDGRAARIQTMLAVSPNTPDGLDIVEDRLRPVTAASTAGDSVLVGGNSAANAELRDATDSDRPIVYPIAAAAIALILALLLRSLVAPMFLLISVGLGFAATLGATALVFQEIGNEPGVTFKLPILVYLFVVAIGTDYNILVTARVREEVADGRSTRDAVFEAIRHTGPTVAAAGVILAGTFASLMISGVSSFIQIGFAVSSGIVLSAFLLGLTLVPALTAMIGDRVWWPARPKPALQLPAVEPTATARPALDPRAGV
jgi:RND superfamily putative drug exporter